MAIVGEAHIIVRALTNRVKGDIRNGFSGSEKLGSQAGKQISGAFSKAFNAAGKDGISFFGRVSKGLQALRPGAAQAYDAFASLQRKFYTMGTAAGGLIGGISSLGSAALALGGALAAAAPAAIALGGAMVSLKLAGFVGKLAMKGVAEAASALSEQQKGLGKTARELREDMQQLAFEAEEAALGEMRAGLSLEQARENLAMVQDLPPNSRARREAELAYAEADLNMRQAIDRNKDLQEQQEKGSRGFGRNPMEDALKGLNVYQKTFAKFLAGLSKYMTRLRLVAARGLLPPLQSAISLIVKKGFPVLEKGVGAIAVAMGKAAKDFAKIITTTQNLKAVNSVMQMSAHFIQQMGKPLGNIFAILVLLLKQAAPLLSMFTKFLNKKTKGFLSDLRIKEATGELRRFFVRAGKLAAQLGAILGNTFGAFGGIVKASVGKNSGGGLLLDWFQEVTAKWKALRNAPEGIEKMRESLYVGAKNAKSLLQLVGDLFRTLFGTLQTPNLQLFFDAVRAGIPSLKDMFEEVGSALPIMGELITNILRFFGAFAQSGAVVEFFKILNGAAKMLANFMEKPMVKAFFKATAKIHAFALAFGMLAIYGGKALDIVVGGAAKFMGFLDKMAQHPILTFLGLLAGAFIYLYKTNADFKASMDESWKAIQDLIKPVVDVINLALKEFGQLISSEVSAGVNKLIVPLTKLAEVLMALIPPLMEAIVPTLKIFVDILVLVIKYGSDLVAQFVSSLVPAIQILSELVGTLLKAFAPLVELLIKDLIPVIALFISHIINLALTLLKDFTPVIKSIIEAITPLVKIFTEMAGTVLRELMDAFYQLTAAFVGKGNGLNGIIGGLVDLFGSLGKIIADTVVPIFNNLVQHIFPLFNQMVAELAPVVIKLITDVLPIIVKIAEAFGEVFLQIANVAIPVISGLVSAFLPIIKVLAEQLIPIFDSLLTAVLPLFKSIIPAITPLISELALFIQKLFEAVVPFIEKLMPSIMSLIGMLQPIFIKLMEVITPIADLFIRLLDPILSLVMLMQDLFLEVIQLVIDIVISLVETLLPLFDIFVKLIDPIESLIKSLLPPLKTIISTVVDVFITLFKSIMPVIDALLDILIPVIDTLIRTVIPPLTQIIMVLVDSFLDLFNAVMPAISGVLKALLPAVADVVKAVSPLVQVLVNQLGPIISDVIIPVIKSLIDPLISIVTVFTDIVKALAPFIAQVVQQLMPVITELVKILVPLIDSLIKMLLPVIKDILTAILPLISVLIADLVPVFGDIITALMPFITTLLNQLIPVVMQLLHALEPIIDLLLDILKPLLPIISDLFKQLLPPILEIVKAFSKSLGPILELLLTLIEPVIDVITTLASILSGTLSIGIAGMVNGLKLIMPAVIGVTDVIAKLATGIVTGLANAFTFLINMAKGFAIVFKQIFTGINIVIKAVLNGLLIAVEAVLNFIIASINTLLDGINIVLDGIKIATFGAVDIHLDPIKPVKLTRLAEGGTVMPSPGGSIVNIAEAGKPERVVPLDSNGLSAGDKAVLTAIKDMAASGAGGPGIEINVYASEGMSVKDLAAEVSRQLSFSMRKGTI